MSIFYALLVAFVLSFSLTPINIYLSKKFGFIDIPKDSRRMHNKPVATVGGISIFLSFLISVLIFIPVSRKLFFVLVGALIIVVTGIVDDKKNIKPYQKFIMQIIAACIVVYGGVRIEHFTNPFRPNTVINSGIFGYLISIIWIVGVSNALNFIDGLDGLCAGLSAISALTFFLVSEQVGFTAVICLALAGACLGFLPYNFNPAKIFMGDTGALFLGYMLGVVSIEGVMKSVAALSLIMPIFILALPVFDTLFAIFRRAINKKKITAADKGHLHHRILKRGFTVKKTVLIMYAFSILFSTMSYLISKVEPSIALVISVLTLILIICIGIFLGFLKKEPESEGGIH